MNDETRKDEVIIIHPPLHGEPHAYADVVEEQAITTVILPDPATLTQPVPSPTADAIARAVPKSNTERAVGLDAMRGFFLLIMTFAMAIPATAGLFPDWMYHMQFPHDVFTDRAGLTWRDITFPAFLFTMCTAIPITNSLRLSKGMSYPGVLWTAAKRFFYLYVFALIIGHANPYWTGDNTKRGNMVAILGFLVCWPIFTRKPVSWNDAWYRGVKLFGWVAAAALLLLVPSLYGRTFSLQHKDDIIHALAVVSFITTSLWLFTRKRPGIRLAAFAIVLALKLSSDFPGPVQDLWNSVNLPVVFESWMIELLLVGIPGTFAGDLIVRWMRQRDEAARVTWSKPRLAAIALSCVACVPIALVGFYNRQVTATALALAASAIISGALVLGAQTDRERIIASLCHWGALLLVCGALVEPVGGGIKKDPQTVSYLIVTAGVAMNLIVAAMIVTDVLKVAQRVTRLVVEVGQNPLLGYVAFMLFFNHISWLIGTGSYFEATRAGALIGCTLFMALTAALTIVATRRKLFWRA